MEHILKARTVSSRRNSFSKVPDLADSERRVEPAVVCVSFFFLSESDNIAPSSNQLIYNAARTKMGWGTRQRFKEQCAKGRRVGFCVNIIIVLLLQKQDRASLSLSESQREANWYFK